MVYRNRLPVILTVSFLLFFVSSAEGHFPIEYLAEYKAMAEVPEEPEISLLETTLRLDIDTAGYYELLAWCERLELSTRGSRKELQNRLYAFYNLPALEEEPEAEPKRVIIIESASKTEYFTLEEIEEDYILLEKDVIVTIRDNETQSIHTIQAEQIIFNQEQNLITASGNVKYSLEEKGKRDEFAGESLSFDVDNWEGVFFSGISQTDRTIEEDEVTFFYSGDTIHRSEKDIITLKKGTITSSDPDNPNYRIAATRIWVFAPGEWSILNAALFVGNVPLLYIPFFFRAGDELFFNPAFGRKDVQGWFLQTSTYLLGEKPKKKSTLSFLQLGETEEEEYRKEIKGLYLRKTEPLSEKEKEKKKKLTDSETYIKVLLDLYSRLGFYSGIEGDLKQYEKLQQWKFQATAGLSRNIYIDPGTGSYTPFWMNEEDMLKSTWNGSYVLGAFVPFRFGLYNHLTLQMTALQLDTNIEYYSDPYYLNYFSDREEDIDWAALIGLEDEAQEGEETPQAPDTVSEDTYTENLDWHLNGSVTVPANKTAPYVSELRLSQMSMSVLWKTRETEQEGITGLDPLLPGYVPESARTSYSFPEKRFFYPESYIFPEASASVAGTVFELPRRDKEREKTEDVSGERDKSEGVLPPWEQQDDEEVKEEEEDKEPYRLPEVMEDLPLPEKKAPVLYSQTLSYAATPNVTLSSRMNSDEWLSPGDIDFSRSYDNVITTGTGTLTYNGNILENLFVLKNTVTMSYDFRNHFNNMTLPEDEWLELLIQDYQANLFKTSNDFSLANSPFLWFPTLDQTKITYNLGFIVFQKYFEELQSGSIPVYTSETVAWDRDFITAHSISTDLKAELWNNIQSLQTVITLPPLHGAVEQTLTTLTGPLTNTMKWSIKEEEKGTEDEPLEEWVLQPFEVTSKVDILTATYLQQYFRYDFEKDRWDTAKSTFSAAFLDSNITIQEELTFGDDTFPPEELENPVLFKYPTISTASIKLYYLTARFSMRRTQPYTFEPDVGWQAETEKEFIPETFNVSVNVDESSDPLWKNRLKLGILFDTGYTMNLIRFTENLFTMKLGFNLSIFKFMNLDFSFSTENKDTYRYFQTYCDVTGQERVPFFLDLVNSFRIFDTDVRREAFFKAKSIDIDLIHRLGDWDLTFNYSGKPELITDDDGFKQYEWDRSFSIFVKWNPIPEIKKQVEYDGETITF